MIKSMAPSIKSEARQQKLYHIKLRDLKECQAERKNFRRLLERLEGLTGHFLADTLPIGLPVYDDQLRVLLLQGQDHLGRLPYWNYLQGDHFGRCTTCGKDIPLHLLTPKRAMTTCAECPAKPAPSLFATPFGTAP